MAHQHLFLILVHLALTHFKVTLTWDQCDLCNPDLKDMLDNLREQIDKIEEQFFSCCPECPAGYRAVSGHCYRLSHDQLPWQQAMDSCVMQGARLASMETKERQEALAKYVQKQTGNRLQKLAYYTSGNSVSGKWFWGQGQEAKKMTYSNWINPEQNGRRPEIGKCIEWQVGRGWNAVPCSTYRYYICEHISDTDITQNDYSDYMAAAQMNVEYLKGQGVGSDDDVQEGQGQGSEDLHEGQIAGVASQGHGNGWNRKTPTSMENGAINQVAAPVRTTAEPPGGTTLITPRTTVTKSARSKIKRWHA